jgi:hypothetical protein
VVAALFGLKHLCDEVIVGPPLEVAMSLGIDT